MLMRFHASNAEESAHCGGDRDRLLGGSLCAGEPGAALLPAGGGDRDLLAHHLLAMVLLTFFSLLVFSNIITALSNLYLSSDLEFCHASPVSIRKPVPQSFRPYPRGQLLDGAGVRGACPLVVCLRVPPRHGLLLRAPTHWGRPAVIAAQLGILVTMILVSVFPAQRTRDIVMLLSIFVMWPLFSVRFLRPERLVDPEAFSAWMQYMSALKAPDSPYLPSHWVTETLWDHLEVSRGKAWISGLAPVEYGRGPQRDQSLGCGRRLFLGFSKRRKPSEGGGGGGFWTGLSCS